MVVAVILVISLTVNSVMILCVWQLWKKTQAPTIKTNVTNAIIHNSNEDDIYKQVDNYPVESDMQGNQAYINNLKCWPVNNGPVHVRDESVPEEDEYIYVTYTHNKTHCGNGEREQ